ncbi:MAG: TonB-dependent receptor domain-containing protein [Gemmatimonadales bacterium]
MPTPSAVRGFLLLASLSSSPLVAQGTGRIIGRVVDAEQGAPIAGAQVELLDAPIRGVSALDGRYTLAGVAAGPVSVRVRMIGYAPKTVTGIVVPAGGTVAQDISLPPEAVQLAEISVSAEAERGTVNRALDQQRNAGNIINAVTAEQIAKSPDSDAGQAVQRVSGVTVQDGKYVFVRGLGERYTTTSLDGARIPSPEPERRVVPLDLFPSSLLESITTSKTFTPEQPGDFSGAQVDLKTREFPVGRVITFSATGGLNDAATGKDVVKAPAVGGEWFGFGGGARKLPPNVQAAGDLSGLTQEQQNGLIGSFRNAWSAHAGSGAPNGSFGVSIGGEDPVLGQPIGYIGSFSYSTAQEVHRRETKGLATITTTPGVVAPFNTYTGSSARSSVLWGGLLNLSTRLGSSSRLSLNNTYTRGADNEGSELAGFNEEFSTDFDFTRLSFIERSVRSNQLAGEHQLGQRSTVSWSVTSAGVTRNEPDRSDVGYLAAPDASGALVPVEWFGQARFATRNFSALDEHSWDLAGNYRLLLGSPGQPATVKVGGAYRTVDRDADSRAYDIVNRTLTDQEREVAPEQIFTGPNAAASDFILNANANAGRYTASDRIAAGYAQVEVPLGRRLQVIGGARVEDWRLDVDTRTVQGTVIPARPRATDVLPSLALNVRLAEDQNLRFSASQTLSRPEYRELSPVPYFEQVGLLTTFGNADLRRALIKNFDARWEWFPNPGEVLSLGVFAKRFTDPIEKVIILSAGAAALSYVNADEASNYGVEVELRKGLGVITPILSPFTLFANTTLMKSDITPGNKGISALTNSSRPMVGQSEYVVNAGLGWATGSGWDATLLYNVAGKRIAEAGAGGLPDAYEQARHLLDASLQFPVIAEVSFKLDAKNLLDAPYRLTQGTVLREEYHLGRVFAFGVTWRP